MRLYGFFTQHSLKALYVLEEVGTDFEFRFVNLAKGEHRREPFASMTPVGKVPLLESDGETLFESGAICRYAANLAESPLYPTDPMQRAMVDQWLDFFPCHLGRWLTKLYFEAVIKPKLNIGDPDEAGIAEANQYAGEQLAIVDSALTESDWLANDAISIADICAFAYIEQHRDIELSLDDYPNVGAWFDRIDSRPAIERARARLP